MRQSRSVAEEPEGFLGSVCPSRRWISTIARHASLTKLTLTLEILNRHRDGFGDCTPEESQWRRGLCPQGCDLP